MVVSEKLIQIYSNRYPQGLNRYYKDGNFRKRSERKQYGLGHSDNFEFLSSYFKWGYVDRNTYYNSYFKSLGRQRKTFLYQFYQKYLIKGDNKKYNQEHGSTDYKGSCGSQCEKLPYFGKTEKIIQELPERQKHPQSDDSFPRASFKVLKLIPMDFKDCTNEDLIKLMARMLDSLITLNDKNSYAQGQQCNDISFGSLPNGSSRRILTRYHSRTPPSISMYNYLRRLSKFNHLSNATLLSTIYYVDLLSYYYQPFFSFTSYTAHRFLLVATMLSQKLMEDFFYTNEHYAKVGGVSLLELNCLELDFLKRVEWRCIPGKHMDDGSPGIRYAKDILDSYYSQLILLVGKNASDHDNILYEVEKKPVFKDSVSHGEWSYESSSAVDLNKYNRNGFYKDGSSSSHLKRRFSPQIDN